MRTQNNFERGKNSQLCFGSITLGTFFRFWWKLLETFDTLRKDKNKSHKFNDYLMIILKLSSLKKNSKTVRFFFQFKIALLSFSCFNPNIYVGKLNIFCCCCCWVQKISHTLKVSKIGLQNGIGMFGNWDAWTKEEVERFLQHCSHGSLQNLVTS